MKKRLLTILLAATVACTVFAGCGSKDSDTKKEATTTTKEASDDTDDEDVAEDGMTSDGKFVSVEAYLNNPTVKSQLDQTIESCSGQGMELSIEATEDELIYIYKYDEQMVDDTFTLEQAASALETSMQSQESTMQSAANSIGACIDLDSITVKCQYYDADGTLIKEFEFISE